jgi:acetyl esterase/lipase
VPLSYETLPGDAIGGESVGGTMTAAAILQLGDADPRSLAQFARNLEAAGVPTTTEYHAGVMHEFFGAAAVLDKAEQAQQQAAAHITRASA